nr:MAG TPA: hypothetical protein [Caudoviricetes sp.]
MGFKLKQLHYIIIYFICQWRQVAVLPSSLLDLQSRRLLLSNLPYTILPILAKW